MSYQVLARKWRPQIFKEMVGQEHVLKALIHALDQQRLHHAYLFTGTRGVGKTTIGRILAKCLNCETKITSEPCGQCDTCREITEGRFVDLIEIDAASRTKVEDMRELLENVQYAPTRGRFKVYLIDEVHMLSQSSFNALLKTLEEPPEHVKFLFATTDPQKLPVTILSRCLQFNLKNMAPERIVGHLKNVLTQESMSFEESALWLLARAADGSMRDALSLTDQAIAYGNRVLAEAEVSAMLGSIDQKQVYRIIEAVANQDAQRVLQEVAALADFSPDYSAVLANIISVLHRVAIEQVVPGSIDNSMGDQQQIVDLASAMSAEDIQLFYQIGLVGRKDLAISPDQRAGVEMALLRMLAFQPNINENQPKLKLSGDVGKDDSSHKQGDVQQASQETSIQEDPVVESAVKEEPVASISSDQNDAVQHVQQLSGQPVAASANESLDALETDIAEVDSVATSPGAMEERAPLSDDAVTPPEAENTALSAPFGDQTPPIADYDESYMQSMAGQESSVFEAGGDLSSISGTQKKRPENVSDIQNSETVESRQGREGLTNDDPVIHSADTNATDINTTDKLQRVSNENVAADESNKPASQETPKTNGASVTSDEASYLNNSALSGAIPEAGVEGSVDLQAYLAMENPWPTLLPLLGLTGMTQNLASNTSLQLFEFGVVVTAAEGHFRLLTDTHKTRIAASFKKLFGEQFSVEILMGEPDIETPAQWRERKRVERLDLAISSIENDQNIKALVNRFDATILKPTVEPID